MAGKRRYQAAKNAGLKEIPAISFDVNEADKVVLTENILHQDLIPLKEAKNSNV
jgi:ParB family chromosome partitioning protein